MFDGTHRRTLDPRVETQLLRMIQEALINVRKHSRASAVAMRLGARDGRAKAIVQDDGAGFDRRFRLKVADGNSACASCANGPKRAARSDPNGPSIAYGLKDRKQGGFQ
jgi:hypothetical protein